MNPKHGCWHDHERAFASGLVSKILLSFFIYFYLPSANFQFWTFVCLKEKARLDIKKQILFSSSFKKRVKVGGWVIKDAGSTPVSDFSFRRHILTYHTLRRTTVLHGAVGESANKEQHGQV